MRELERRICDGFFLGKNDALHSQRGLGGYFLHCYPATNKRKLLLVVCVCLDRALKMQEDPAKIGLLWEPFTELCHASPKTSKN